MERKLTDKEIVKAYEYCYINRGACKSCCLSDEDKLCVSHEDVLDLINRQKAEIERLTEERDKAKRDNTSLIYAISNAEKQNAELQKQVDKLKEENEYLDIVAKQALGDYQNAEFKVDELTEERENMQAVIFGLEEEKRQLKKENAKVISFNDTLYREKQQAVKDTAVVIAKEILQPLYDEATCNVSETVELTTFQIEQYAEYYGVVLE